MALNNLLDEITSISHWVLENLLHTATIKSAQAFCFYWRQYDFSGSTYTVDQFLVRGLEKKLLLIYIYSILLTQTISNDLSDAPLNFTLLWLRLFFLNFQERKYKKYCVMQFSISVIPGPAFTYPNIYSETLLYEHPPNTNTSLLRTVFFVPGERKFSHILWTQSA